MKAAVRTPEDVQRSLDDLRLGIQVRVQAESTATSEEAAAAAGCELGQIVKSLCFDVNGEPVLLLTAGDQRVSTRKLADRYGIGRKRIRMASPEMTLETTGFEPGGVSPFALATDVPMLLDRTLERFETVWVAAGAPNAIFPIGLASLQSATGATLADFTEG